MRSCRGIQGCPRFHICIKRCPGIRGGRLVPGSYLETGTSESPCPLRAAERVCLVKKQNQHAHAYFEPRDGTVAEHPAGVLQLTSLWRGLTPQLLTS
jgi:hypothetical protein